MQSSHPFSLALPLKDNIDLAASLAANGKTADPTGAVKLIKGNVECTSCHNPHVQAKDLVSQNFLVKDSSSGAVVPGLPRSHAAGGRPGKPAGRLGHQRARHVDQQDLALSPVLGSYTTVAADACISCHTPHNGPATGCACCAARMNRLASPATTAPTSLPWRPTPTYLPSTPRPRSGIPSRLDQSARCRREHAAQQQPPCHLRGLPQRTRVPTGWRYFLLRR